MKRLTGKMISGGIAIGKVIFVHKRDNAIPKENVENITEEFRRFENAKKKVLIKIEEIYNQALSSYGEDNAEILNAHKMILEDEDYNESIINLIKNQKMNAEYAVKVTGDSFERLFASMDDDTVRGRALDIKDITNQIIDELMNVKDNDSWHLKKGIITATELTPSDLLKMDKNLIAGIVTEKGTVNSHIGILARTLGIPAITLDNIKDNISGQTAILDAELGELIVSPDSETLKFYEEAKRQDELNKEGIRKSLISEERTDGIKLFANVGRVDDITVDVLELSDGIGLFRSEFLFLESSGFPSEKEQFETYRRAAMQFTNKPVVIRTLDIGEDKQAIDIGLNRNESLSAGIRGIRMSLMCEDIFRTQLRAILRASSYGKLAIMYPMVTSLNEVIAAKRIVEEVKAELTHEGYSFDKNIRQGVMIETPAAVMISDDLAREVDFFSIGTNDLTQLTLATNRYNERLERFFDAGNEAILRMIKMVVENAHAEGISVCVCGEMASKAKYVKTLRDIGVDELSVSTGSILGIKRLLMEIQ